MLSLHLIVGNVVVEQAFGLPVFAWVVIAEVAMLGFAFVLGWLASSHHHLNRFVGPVNKPVHQNRPKGGPPREG